MPACRILKIAAVTIAVTFAFAACNSQNNNQPLSVDETMGLIFGGSSDYHLFRLANPEAKPAVYSFLGDDHFGEYHFQAVRVLGWIGDQTDVKKLREMTDPLENTLNAANRRKMRAILEAWATMNRRGVAGADDELQRFCLPPAWKEANFSWRDPEVVEKKPDVAYDGCIEAIQAYCVFGDGDMTELRDGLLGQVENEEARDRINFYITEKYIAPDIEKRKQQEARPVTPADREKLRGQLDLFAGKIEAAATAAEDQPKAPEKPLP